MVTSSFGAKLMVWDWKFVKHYRAHLSAIHGLSISVDGELACTVGDDKTAKVFDVINFDMISMMKLDFMPCGCCFIYTPKMRYLAWRCKR
ncbi:hypothetical protein AHF37_04278 [Paragonimus kellicotti]|nr:hypothetical protein AHF37_04278 [Paragonimus kellicotti]